MDFGLSRFNARLRTRRLELPEISDAGAPPLTLIVANLGMDNSGHYSWLLKHAAPDQSAIPAEGTKEWISYNRLRNAECFGEAAIVGWENVLADGQPVECTPEHAVDFMRQLLDQRPDVFDRVGTFIMKRDQPEPTATPPTDPEVLGKE